MQGPPLDTATEYNNEHTVPRTGPSQTAQMRCGGVERGLPSSRLEHYGAQTVQPGRPQFQQR